MKIRINTAVSEKEASVLRKLCYGRPVIEIGALLGFSTVHMALTATQVVSIDPHSGYPQNRPSSTFHIFKRNLDKYCVSRRVDIIRATAQNTLPNLKGDYDVTFIDTTGEYKNTSYCLEHSKTPINVVHDFLRWGCEGVEEAVVEHIRKHNKTLEVIDTLAIIR